MLFGKRKQTVSLEELRQRTSSGIATQKGDAEILATMRSGNGGSNGETTAVPDATTIEQLGIVTDDAHSALDIALGRHTGVTKTLVARDLVKTYRGRNVVNHVNITLRT